LDVPLPSPPRKDQIKIKDEGVRKVGPDLLPNLPPEETISN